MESTLELKVLLFISGLIGIVVGCGMLLAPEEFHATAGIVLGTDVNLLNEMRASGGAVLGAGSAIFLGAFVTRFRFTSTVVATTLYLSYGLSRLLSVLVDGLPGATLLGVAALEIGVGVLCAVSLSRFSAPGSRDAAHAG